MSDRAEESTLHPMVTKACDASDDVFRRTLDCARIDLVEAEQKLRDIEIARESAETLVRRLRRVIYALSIQLDVPHGLVEIDKRSVGVRRYLKSETRKQQARAARTVATKGQD